MQTQQVIYLAILVAAIGVLMTERLRNDVVAVLIIVALAATRVLKPDEAVAGFASEPAVVVAGIFVMTGALYQTGVSETIGNWIGRAAGGSLTRALAVSMPSVAALSAFTHHVTTTAIMVPVAMNVSREHKGMPASKLLMPISFAASLGTAITIIGAPAFLVASDTLEKAGRPGLGIFSISPIGIAMSVAGTIFILVLGRFLLPSRQGAEDTSERFRLDDYFTELTILTDSPILGKTPAEVREDPQFGFNIVGWMRHGRHMPRPYGKRTFHAGDVLLVRATPEEIVRFREEGGLELEPVARYGHRIEEAVDRPEGDDKEVTDQLVQVVVAPRSDLTARTLAEIDFLRRYGAIVVSIWRKSGWLNEELSKIRLRPGDVLVLLGSENALARVANERGFLMMVPFQSEVRRTRKALTAAAIMLAAIVLTAFNVLSLEIAALAGAAAVVLAGCMTPRQAYRSIDQRIYVFIAGAIPLGTAMKNTGLAELIAKWLGAAVAGWSPFMICIAIYIVVAVVTQFMSDAATTAIFAPVAAALAATLGHAPEAYVVTVAMSAVTAFLTPIGHHGNLLIYGPGGYKFGDFVRVGAPLTVVVAAVIAFLAPRIWPIANVS